MYNKLIATNVVLDIANLKTYKEDIEIWCADDFQQYYYPVFGGLIIDSEEQILITGVKANKSYFICYVLLKKRDYVTKNLEFQTHELTCE